MNSIIWLGVTLAAIIAMIYIGKQPHITVGLYSSGSEKPMYTTLYTPGTLASVLHKYPSLEYISVYHEGKKVYTVSINREPIPCYVMKGESAFYEYEHPDPEKCMRYIVKQIRKKR